MIPLISERADELTALCRDYNVQSLELFGSAAIGEYRAHQSDLDFLVEFHTLPEGRYADAYFGLYEALEDLFHCSVDLVVDSAIENPYFRQSVDKSRLLLYAD